MSQQQLNSTDLAFLRAHDDMLKAADHAARLAKDYDTSNWITKARNFALRGSEQSPDVWFSPAEDGDVAGAVRDMIEQIKAGAILPHRPTTEEVQAEQAAQRLRDLLTW
jgi:hypothetical protein